MKKLSLAIALLLALMILNANSTLFFRMNNTWVDVNTNLTFSSNIVSSVNFTNVQNTYGTFNHTFHFVNNSVGTNTTIAALDRTIDQQNWYNVTTNTFTTNGVYEYSVSANAVQYRWRVYCQATNTTLIGLYMAR